MTDKPTYIVLAVAEQLWQAESYRAAGRRRREEWSDLSNERKNQWIFMAAAAVETHTEALKAAGMVIIKREDLDELCRDVTVYVNDHYAGDHPYSIKKREANLAYVKEILEGLDQ